MHTEPFLLRDNTRIFLCPTEKLSLPKIAMVVPHLDLRQANWQFASNMKARRVLLGTATGSTTSQGDWRLTHLTYHHLLNEDLTLYATFLTLYEARELVQLSSAPKCIHSLTYHLRANEFFGLNPLLER